MMRAKVTVQALNQPFKGAEEVVMRPVSGNSPYGPNGESEDNTFARYTPSGEIKLTITNPDLKGKFDFGDTFYVDFTPVDENTNK
jgi:hypothetical protein